MKNNVVYFYKEFISRFRRNYSEATFVEVVLLILSGLSNRCSLYKTVALVQRVRKCIYVNCLQDKKCSSLRTSTDANIIH